MERITCSAIWAKYLKKGHFNPVNVHEGLVIAGHRHCNCLEALNAIDRHSGKRQQECEQGFLTSENRYVNREEGRMIAFEAGQTHKTSGILYSEDLY